jgi:hypothetical protein
MLTRSTAAPPLSRRAGTPQAHQLTRRIEHLPPATLRLLHDPVAAPLRLGVGGSGARDWSDQDPEFNASVIAELVDMKATEAAPLMAAAFEADAVDISVNGD